jgi:hypothetical protein
VKPETFSTSQNSGSRVNSSSNWRRNSQQQQQQHHQHQQHQQHQHQQKYKQQQTNAYLIVIWTVGAFFD